MRFESWPALFLLALIPIGHLLWRRRFRPPEVGVPVSSKSLHSIRRLSSLPQLRGDGVCHHRPRVLSLVLSRPNATLVASIS